MRGGWGLALTAVLFAGACSSGSADTTDPVIPESDGSEATETAATDVSDEADLGSRPAIVDALEASDSAAPEQWVGDDTVTSFVTPRYTPAAAGATADPAAMALAYFDEFAEAYGVSEPAARLVVESVTESAAGTIVRLTQTLDGLPVYAGEIAVAVSAEGRVDRVVGVLVPDTDVAEPTLSAADALAAALAAVDSSSAAEPEPRLVAFSPSVDRQSTEPTVPAWEVTVAVADEGGSEELVLVNAIDGDVLLVEGLDMTEDWDLSDAGNQLDDDGDSTLAEAELVFETRDGEVTTIGTPDDDATSAGGHFSTTWQYYFDTHGRDAFDDKGGKCNIYTHVGVGWFNASSNKNCTVRIGDARAYAQSLDVLAHELTHSVTGQTSGLKYEGQSGALNEHFSDFFATMIDRSDWVIDIVNRDTTAPAINRFSVFWNTDEDKGGVHSNSGIGNMAGYLVAADGVNVHVDTGVEVQGIGRGKAEQLWYATLLSLSPRTDLHTWACATISTARDIDSLSEDDVESVTNAMLAVELVTIDNGVLVCDQFSGGPGGRGVTTPPVTVPPSSTEPTTPTTPGEPTETASCDLVGVWRLRDQVFFDEINRVAGGGVGGTIEYVSGDYIVTINADGTALGSRREWTFKVGTPEGNLVIRISSEDPGTWNDVDGTITFSDQASEATVEIFVDVNGQLVPLPIQNTFNPSTAAIEGTATYTCVDDVLTVTTTSDGATVSVALDRVG